MIASDPQIKFCIEGRDLTQIAPDADRTMTKARFPHLLDQVKMQIAIAALRQAQTNYQARYNEYLTAATKDASADIAQYMCQMLPVTGGAPVGRGALVSKEQTELAPPYAISYEVGAGLNNKLLAHGGRGTSATSGATHVDNRNAAYEGAGANAARIAAAAVSLGASEGVNAMSGVGGKTAYDIPGGVREIWATFNRDTRICRLCSSTVTKDCSSLYKRGFLGIGQKSEVNCTESEPIEKCDDIEM